jgi:nucleoside-diphosphate-sugar epimerase
VSRGLAAVTGATGFLGQHIVRALADDGWRVRLLVRRDPTSLFWRGLTPEIIPGDLSSEAALGRLCTGADVVVNNAGLIAGAPADLTRVNVEGGRRVAQAAAAAGVGRLVQISSLAAREPQLSAYAASKAAGEAAVREVLGAQVTIVRPPAIYGPGDRETLRLFQVARVSPLLPVVDPTARLALIHGEDAARQIAWLASESARAGFAGLADDRPEGYGWREIMLTAAAAFGRAPRLVRLPHGALYMAASLETAAGIWRRKVPMLTVGKVRELTHVDWGVQPQERVPEAPAPWYDLLSGFQQTIAWYRRQGWL